MNRLEPNAAIALLVSFAGQIDFAIPVLVILVAQRAVAIGRLRR